MTHRIALGLTVMVMLHSGFGLRAEESADQFGRFGKIALYRPSAQPSHVVLFVSGDGGWNLGVIDMARELAALDALVVGVDITAYLKQLEKSSEPCVYPAALPTRPEIDKLGSARLLCIYGEEETNSLCRRIQGDHINAVGFHGAHHFGGDYATIAKGILEELK